MKTLTLLLLFAWPLAAATAPVGRQAARAAAASLLDSDEPLMLLRYDVRGEGPATVVLLNGDSVNVEVWDRQVAALMPHFRVLRYDRGSRASLGGAAFSASVDDLYDLLCSLGIARVHLVATGDGSRVAELFAARHAAMVDRVVVANPHGEGDGARTRTRPERACISLVSAAVGGAVVADGGCAVAAGVEFPIDERDAIGTPVASRLLLITGGDDFDGAVERQLEVWRLDGPVSNVTVPGVSGLVNVERPLLFNAAVLRFLLAP